MSWEHQHSLFGKSCLSALQRLDQRLPTIPLFTESIRIRIFLGYQNSVVKTLRPTYQFLAFYHSYSKDTSPNVVCCGIRNAIPDLAIRLPKAVLAGGSRITLPRASLKHVGVPRFRYSRSPESLPKCLSPCQGFRLVPGESNRFSSIPSYDQIIPHVLYKYEASASNISISFTLHLRRSQAENFLSFFKRYQFKYPH